MVSGFVTGVQGHIANKHVVVAKVKLGLHIVVMVVSTIANMFLTLFQAVLIHINTLITTSESKRYIKTVANSFETYCTHELFNLTKTGRESRTHFNFYKSCL